MWLAVAVFLKVAALLFVFDNVNCLVASDFRYGGVYLSFGNIGRADGGVFAVVHEKHFVEDELVSHLESTRYFFNFNNISHGDFVLLAACLYDREFHSYHILQRFNKKSTP